MKRSIFLKVSIISLVFVLGVILIPSVYASSSSEAQQTYVTLTGTVTDISPNGFTIQKSIPWYHFYYYFLKIFPFKQTNRSQIVNISVTDNTVFFQKGGTNSNQYTQVTFQALKKKDKVVVKAIALFPNQPLAGTRSHLPEVIYEAKEVKIVTPYPALPQQADNICFSNKTGRSMDLKEAENIAQRDCGDAGVIDINKEQNCNRITGTWWLGLYPKEPKQGCNPACVVNIDTEKAEVNWRCTGLIPSNQAHTFDIKGVVFRGDKVGVKGTLQLISCSNFEAYNIYVTPDTKYSNALGGNLSQIQPGDIIQIKGQKVNKTSYRPDYWEYTATSVIKTGPLSFPGTNGWSA